MTFITELLPAWFPGWHPVVVHMPLAILGLAISLDLLRPFVNFPRWVRPGGILLYLTGSVFMLWAFFSGEAAAGNVQGNEMTEKLIDEHYKWALWMVWFFGIYSIIRITLYFKLNDETKAVKFIFLLAAVLGLILLIQTGFLGSRLVYELGLGTVGY